MLTASEYVELRARLDKHEAWVDTIRDKRTGWASYKPEDMPEDVPHISNEERSAIEVYEFCRDKPDRYFLYIKPDAGSHYPPHGLATTWTGQILGHVDFDREYRCHGFYGRESVRVPIWVHAINGVEYFGTYYKSAGSYARIRARKVK